MVFGSNNQADAIKDEGNKLFLSKRYREAVEKYTQAINISPNTAAYYTNRATAYQKMGRYPEAIQDCKTAIEKDSTFIKGYLKLAQNYRMSGDINSAISFLDNYSQTHSLVKDLNTEYNLCLRCRTEKNQLCELSTKMLQEEENEDWSVENGVRKEHRNNASSMYARITKLMDNLPGDISIHIILMQNYIYQRKFDTVLSMTTSYLKEADSNYSSIILYLRATALYYMNDVDKALDICRRLLQNDPDYKYAQQLIKRMRSITKDKDAANSLFKAQNYKQAISKYQDLAKLDVFNYVYNSLIFNNIAACYLSLKDNENALINVNKSISLDNTNYKAYLRRYRIYKSMGDKDSLKNAISDLNKLKNDFANETLDIDPDNEIETCNRLIKNASKKDYYKILNLDRNASEEEIKKAYKKMAMKYHPDRLAGKDEETRKQGEEKFKDINEAYQLLTDPEKKKLIDMGIDPNDPESGNPFAGASSGGMGGMNMNGIDLSQIFSMFGGMGGMPSGASFSFGGMPSGNMHSSNSYYDDDDDMNGGNFGGFSGFDGFPGGSFGFGGMPRSSSGYQSYSSGGMPRSSFNGMNHRSNTYSRGTR